MKRLLTDSFAELKKLYSADQIREVGYCRDEIRGLANQYRRRGYDDSEIEEVIGDYLDEIYEVYQKSAGEDFGLTEAQFDEIYSILEDIDGPIIV